MLWRRTNPRYGWALVGGVLLLVILALVWWWDRGRVPEVSPSPPGPVGSGVGTPDVAGEPPRAGTSVDEELSALALAEDIPPPRELEIHERRFAAEGVPRLEDAVVLWQKDADDYVGFLRKRTFEQSAYRTRDWSELGGVIGNEGNFDPTNPRTPMFLARTRRFSKLVFHVNEARNTGETDAVVGALERTVERLLSDRRKLEETILGLVETEPEIFADDATDSQRNRTVDLFSGFGLSGYDAPDELIPPSVRGTQFGLLANSILLGLTQDARAVEPLVAIASYDGSAFVEKLPFRFSRDYSVAAPHAVVVDALDRILVGCGDTQGIGPKARTVAREYAQWRTQRGFPDREVYQVYPYDAALIPYDLPGMVTRVSREAKTFPLELPIPPGETENKGFTKQDISQILEWAQRFHEAEQGD